MTHRMYAELFKLNGAAFCLAPPIGGLLVRRNTNFAVRTLSVCRSVRYVRCARSVARFRLVPFFDRIRTTSTCINLQIFHSPQITHHSSSCHYCSMDLRAGRRLRIWRDETKLSKTNATGRCSAYHTKNKKTNDYVWQPVSSRRTSGLLL